MSEITGKPLALARAQVHIFFRAPLCSRAPLCGWAPKVVLPCAPVIPKVVLNNNLLGVKQFSGGNTPPEIFVDNLVISKHFLTKINVKK